MLFIFAFFIQAAISDIVINTRLGRLRGVNITAFPSSESTIGFLGITVAKPPILDLRFREPVPYGPWTGIQNATQYSVACLADPPLTYKGHSGPIGEDCIKFNVFTNDFCLKTKSCAVVAIVHGGKYNFESPVIFPKETVANNFVAQGRNVIAVTVPFRLGFLGYNNLFPFLKTSITKNAALRDIVFNLQWIQENIMDYGGDPKRVTLMGHSSGAMLVDTLSKSPVVAGLFSQVILMSGATALYGAHTSQRKNEKASRKMASLLGCSTTDTQFLSLKNKKAYQENAEQIIACLRQIDADTILEAQNSLVEETFDFLGPCLDEFLFPRPLKELRRPPRRTLVGTLTAEFSTKFVENPDTTTNVPLLRELCAQFGYQTSFKNKAKFMQACVHHYTYISRARTFFSEYSFYATSANVADELTEDGAEVFVYSYSYNKAGAAFKNITTLPLDERPIHSEDYIYLMGIHRGIFTDKDYENEKTYSGIIANFVNSAVPHVGWKPWTIQDRNYFNIDFDNDMASKGAKTGYYINASKMWSEENLSQHVEITDYPKDFDCVDGENTITAMDSHYLNFSTAHDKTFDAEQQIYFQWTEWLFWQISTSEVRPGMNAVNDFFDVEMALPSHTEEEFKIPDKLDFWTIILIVFIVLLALFIIFLAYKGCKKLCRYRERCEYQALVD